MADSEAPIFIHITINVKGAVKPAEWKLVMATTGNTSKICYSENEALRLKKDKHKIVYSPVKISFGATGDDDNIIKPVKDLMEDLAIIPNDRQGCFTVAEFTYNNKNNSIDIEVEEMATVIDENNVYRFERLDSGKEN